VHSQCWSLPDGAIFIVVGIDAIPETLNAIHNKMIAATVNIRPYIMGSAAFMHAFELVQGWTA
jgi:ABC-type sugar transport system substrate-binding protein